MANRSPRPSLRTRAQAWVSNTSHLVLVTGGLSVLVSVLAIGALAVNDFRATLANDLAHAAMLARILEDQATRTVETAELALEALANAPALESAAAGKRRWARR